MDENNFRLIWLPLASVSIILPTVLYIVFETRADRLPNLLGPDCINANRQRQGP